jgi:uncharacterized membrane protein YsdA (DUF1294 family)
MTLTTNQVYIIAALIIINLLSFVTMLFDKIKSTTPGAERISEGMLFFMATAFGSFGVYAGMFAIRHKNKKWYFLIGIPLLMVENLATAYLIFLLFFQTRF